MKVRYDHRRYEHDEGYRLFVNSTNQQVRAFEEHDLDRPSTPKTVHTVPMETVDAIERLWQWSRRHLWLSLLILAIATGAVLQAFGYHHTDANDCAGFADRVAGSKPSPAWFQAMHECQDSNKFMHQGH